MFRSIWDAGFRTFGWKIVNPFKDLPKAIIAVAPHTSSWDVVIGMAVRSIMKMTNAHYLGKKELFESPFGWFFRVTGGVPVDRSSKHNMVEQVAEIFNKNEHFILAMAPEGTRKRVDKLRSGFWHIAHAAGVPIVLAGFDYKNREVRFSEPFTATDEASDMQRVITFFREVQGKDPSRDLRHL